MFTRVTLCAVFFGLCASMPRAQDVSARPAPLSDDQIEKFLQHARVVHTQSTTKGLTGSLRVTLSDGTLTHDAQIQQVDEKTSQFVGFQSTELDFRDTWSYNVAAYRVDRLLGFNLVPVSVERKWQMRPAAFTWWVDDVQMDEEERQKRKVLPPDTERWNQQMQLVRLFDQLIGNTDRNLGNLLITPEWQLIMIDHTRCFKSLGELKTPKDLTFFSKSLMESLKGLNAKEVETQCGKYISGMEINAMLERRNKILALYEKVAETPGAVYP